MKHIFTSLSKRKPKTKSAHKVLEVGFLKASRLDISLDSEGFASLFAKIKVPCIPSYLEQIEITLQMALLPDCLLIHSFTLYGKLFSLIPPNHQLKPFITK